MFGLTYGELFVVAFVTAAVLSARWWPRTGEAIAEMLLRRHPGASGRPEAEGDKR